MRNRFGEQLERLHVEMIQMGALCEDAISAAAQALMKGDEDLARAAGEAEREIDQKEREVENLCLKLLLQQQPVARDLREISSALKMISDLERIGDQAVDIAGIVKKSDVVTVMNHHTHVLMMAARTLAMVTKAVDSFVKKDLDAANEVIKADDEVDALFSKVKKEVISLIHEDPEKGEACVAIVMIAKYFERIGDHASNIAEWVEFSMTGEYKGGSL